MQNGEIRKKGPKWAKIGHIWRYVFFTNRKILHTYIRTVEERNHGIASESERVWKNWIVKFLTKIGDYFLQQKISDILIMNEKENRSNKQTTRRNKLYDYRTEQKEI